MLAAEHVIRDNDFYVVYMQHRSMAEGGPFEISCRETRDFEYEMRRSMRDCLLHFKNGRAPNGRTDQQHNLILGFNKKSKRSYLKQSFYSTLNFLVNKIYNNFFVLTIIKWYCNNFIF